MGEVVNVIVAFAVIVFIFRWATSNGSEGGTPSPADTLGFRPKNVTQDMVDTVGNMFPDIPRDNIRYDLLLTGNVERTTNKILEKGFLDAPPPSYYTLYPRSGPNATTPGVSNNAAASSSSIKPKNTLISRYNLQSKLNDSSALALLDDAAEVGGGKAKWEDTPEKREASLKERKEKMILAARQRMLAMQKEKEKESAATRNTTA
ncbi:hypothetical protein J3R30DRAFT_3508639 [Lentinula aciculospora]|uniref:CUE domain-containing protein n=1 Tax=Lentinula aciculospora TaxID=153920 RepID=A0A9W9A4L2_9AGAR|nr:hypothetical protein J3R30DRAFT_3508639 [Lentinula aciculospora]